MSAPCKYGVMGWLIVMAAVNMSRAEVDWGKMMTVAERKREAQGNHLPLQSYDETIRCGMDFLLKESWFQYNQWWYSCHAGVVPYLLDFEKGIRKSDSQEP